MVLVVLVVMLVVLVLVMFELRVGEDIWVVVLGWG